MRHLMVIWLAMGEKIVLLVLNMGLQQDMGLQQVTTMMDFMKIHPLIMV